MTGAVLKQGTIIYVKRSFYKHYGIYIGGKNVIEFAPKNAYELEAKKAMIIKVDIDTFLKGGKLYIDKKKSKTFKNAEIVQRAKLQLGKMQGEYNIFLNNCEHFAIWCKTGKSKSYQVEKIFIGIVMFLLYIIFG